MTTPINETRTKERAKESNEVFTPSWLVKQMLDTLNEYQPEVFTDPNTTFLEPTCGNGRFLTAMLSRRLDNMCSDGIFYPSKALRGLYGIDIQASNVEETREAMLETIKIHAEKCSKDRGNKGSYRYWNSRSKARMMKILQRNIVCGDCLKLLGDPDYNGYCGKESDNYHFYTFNIDQPDPHAFNMEDKIDEERPRVIERYQKEQQCIEY